MSKHRTIENRVWVSYKDGVYDITDFLKSHPGGSDKLMMVAGGAIEPFWELYSFHKRKDIFDMLNKYKVGDLDPKDILKED